MICLNPDEPMTHLRIAVLMTLPAQATEIQVVVLIHAHMILLLFQAAMAIRPIIQFLMGAMILMVAPSMPCMVKMAYPGIRTRILLVTCHGCHH